MLDWTSLNDFLAVAETGSLSAGARRLRISQPTMGRRIAALEAHLNSRLFDRTPAGFALTGLGESILENTRSMEQEALAVERIATGAERTLEGIVRLSIHEDLGTRWLTPNLPEFHEKYPGIQLEVHMDITTVNLVRREADIALRLIRESHRPEQADLVARLIGRHAYALYASKDYAARRGLPKSPEDFKGHEAVSFDTYQIHSTSGEWLGRIFGEARVVYRSNSLVAQLEATRAGLGIGALSCMVACHYPDLVRVFPDRSHMEINMWLLTHSDQRRSARIRAVLDFMADIAKRDQELLLGWEKGAEGDACSGQEPHPDI